MKGRADDRRLFERDVTLNVMAFVDSLRDSMQSGWLRVWSWPTIGLQLGDLTELKRLFEHATTFGSLIQIPEKLAAKLPALKELSGLTSQDLFMSDALQGLATAWCSRPSCWRRSTTRLWQTRRTWAVAV